MSGFVKNDSEKPMFSLFPPEALTAVAEVLSYGAKIYQPNNWVKGAAWSRYYSAAQRHLNKFWGGQDFDPDSGLHHLPHAICSLLFLYVYSLRKIGTDDRLKYEPSKAVNEEMSKGFVVCDNLPGCGCEAISQCVNLKPKLTTPDVDSLGIPRRDPRL
jgi:hypothetical protein